MLVAMLYLKDQEISCITIIIPQKKMIYMSRPCWNMSCSRQKFTTPKRDCLLGWLMFAIIWLCEFIFFQSRYTFYKYKYRRSEWSFFQQLKMMCNVERLLVNMLISWSCLLTNESSILHNFRLAVILSRKASKTIQILQHSKVWVL